MVHRVDLTASVATLPRHHERSPVSTLSVNGWRFGTCKVPREAVIAMGSLLMACIIRSGNQRRLRRGSITLGQSCFSGMAGQLAAHRWLQEAGFEPIMSPIAPGSDDGFDIEVGGYPRIKIDVKTGLLAARGAATLRHGDAMEYAVGRTLNAPDVFLWCLTDPECVRGRSGDVMVNIVAAMPLPSMQQKRPSIWSS